MKSMMTGAVHMELRRDVSGVRVCGTVLILLAIMVLSAGVVDSASLQALPVKSGSGWVFRNGSAESEMRIAGREQFAGLNCYRVDWLDDVVYQSEYWLVTDEGILVAGRRVMDHLIRFDAPYLLLRHKLIAGDSWDAVVSHDSFSETLKFTVGMDEEVATPAGRFRSTPVTVRGKTIVYRRWYVKGVGLVREETFLPDGYALDEKSLTRRFE